MKAKCNQKWLRGAKTASLRESSLLNEGGGGVFGCKNVPLPRFYILNAGVARLGELSSPRRANLYLFFFFGGGINHASPPLWFSVCLLEPT